MYTLIGALLLLGLIPLSVKIARICHLKHLGVKYVGKGKYEQIGNKKYRWYEWLR